MIPTRFLWHSGWVDLCDHPKCGPPGGAILPRFLVVIMEILYSNFINITFKPADVFQIIYQLLSSCLSTFLLSVITCPPVPQVAFAEFDTNIAIYGTVVKYTCDRGYQFPSNSSVEHIECLETGAWNRTLPPCEGQHHPILFFVTICYKYKYK